MTTAIKHIAKAKLEWQGQLYWMYWMWWMKNAYQMNNESNDKKQLLLQWKTTHYKNESNSHQTTAKKNKRIPILPTHKWEGWGGYGH